MYVTSFKWLGGSLMWVVLHFLLWDGRVNSIEDLEASIRSPGQDDQLRSKEIISI